MRRVNLKTWVLSLTVALTIAKVSAGTIECAYLTGSKLVPVNKTAIRLAKSLGVTTCGRDSSSKFQIVAKSSGMQGKVVAMTPERRAAYEKFYVSKLTKRKVSKAVGASLW